MQKIVIVVIVVLGIVGFISPFFYYDKIQKYIRKRKGELISTENKGYGRSKTIYIKYFDKNRNIRSVSLNYFGPFPFFGHDTIIEYDTDSPEFKKLQEKEMLDQINFEKKRKSFEEHHYTLNDNQWLTIKQEFAQPNIGEYAYLNNKVAPNGKYKIGFMRYIYITDGVISEIKTS